MIFIITIIVLLLAIPAGFLIAWMARDELLIGRIWFKIIAAVSSFFAIVMYLFEEYPSAYTSIFILIVSSISYLKTKDRKWAKRI